MFGLTVITLWYFGMVRCGVAFTLYKAVNYVV